MHISGAAPSHFNALSTVKKTWPQKKPSGFLAKDAVDTTYHGLLVVPDQQRGTLRLVPKPQPARIQDFAFYLGERLQGSPVPAEVDEAWRRRSGMGLTESLKALFAGTSLTSKNANMSAVVKDRKLDCLDFDMRLQSESSGERAGTMARYFQFCHPDGPTVEHAYLSLAPDFQDAGIAKTLLSNSVELYGKLGIDRVTLTAGLEVGGYAWAKYGFKPDCKESLFQLYDEVRWNLEQLDMPARAYQAVKRLMNSGDPKTIWALSDLETMVTDDYGRRMKLGKALLLGTGWSGELDLKDEESMTRFRQYVSREQ